MDKTCTKIFDLAQLVSKIVECELLPCLYIYGNKFLEACEWNQ